MEHVYNCAFCGKKCASEFAGDWLCEDCQNLPRPWEDKDNKEQTYHRLIKTRDFRIVGWQLVGDEIILRTSFTHAVTPKFKGDLTELFGEEIR